MREWPTPDDPVEATLRSWCDHDGMAKFAADGCSLRETRYDNCRCAQQAIALRELRYNRSLIGRLKRAWEAMR